jgi:hypothetical protein
MLLTDDEIKALRDGCEGVTPGPWVTRVTTIHGKEYGKRWIERADEELLLISGTGGARSYTREIVEAQKHDDSDTNAAHIARCDPTTIAELCNRLLSAEARVRVLEGALREIADASEDQWLYDFARAALQEPA